MNYIKMYDIIYYDNFFGMYNFKDNYSNGFVFLVKNYHNHHKNIFNFYVENDLDEINHIYNFHPEEEFDLFLIDTNNLKIFNVK